MKMTANRRIALNIAATYARNIYKLALGLITARWLLLSLGKTDYGLLGVVGGLIAFVTFFNRILSSSVSRFYAVSIGAAKRKGNKEKGLEECRRWFTAALSVHTVVPFILVLLGYPLGTWAVREFLTIPPDRVEACIWVWRFTCLSSLTGMINVPFRAMYNAKQEIAELTIYSVAETTLNAILLWYMINHPGDWLAKYALWHCLIAISPRILICLRAIRVYPECRIRRDCLWNWPDIRKMASFAGWNALGAAGRILRGQGIAILVNKMFGPVQNAAVTVANRLAGRTNSFAASLVGSFSPAITAAYGAGKIKRMMNLAYRVDKLGASIVAIFSLPLLLEVKEVMILWLKNPPDASPFLCACVLIRMFADKMTVGQNVVITATGRIKAYQLMSSMAHVGCVIMAWLLMLFGVGIVSVAISLLANIAILAVIRIILAAKQAQMSPWPWLKGIAIPLFASISLAAILGWMPRLFMQPSFARVCATTALTLSVMLPMVWLAVLDSEERVYIREKGAKVIRKFKGG